MKYRQASFTITRDERGFGVHLTEGNQEIAHNLQEVTGKGCTKSGGIPCKKVARGVGRGSQLRRRKGRKSSSSLAPLGTIQIIMKNRATVRPGGNRDKRRGGSSEQKKRNYWKEGFDSRRKLMGKSMKRVRKGANPQCSPSGGIPTGHPLYEEGRIVQRKLGLEDTAPDISVGVSKG